MHPLARRIAAIVLGCLVLAACTGDGAGTAMPTPVPPLPTTAEATPTLPSASPSPSPSMSALSGDDATALLLDGLAIGFESDEAPGAGPSEAQTAAIQDLTTPGGTARDFLSDQLALATGPDVSFRGEVMGAALADPVADSEQASAEICVATVVDNAVEGGADLGKSDHYTTHDVVYELVGDGWMLVDVSVPGVGDDGSGAACVPPTLAADLTATWEGYAAAREALVADTSDVAATAAMSAFTVQPVEPIDSGVRVEYADVHDGLEIATASPDQAETSWCVDMSRDPQAQIVLEDGSTLPPDSEVWTGTWRIVDGEWKLDEFRQFSGPDGPTDELQAAWDRCFA